MDLPTSLLPVVRLLSALPNRVGFLSGFTRDFSEGTCYHRLLYPEQGFKNPWPWSRLSRLWVLTPLPRALMSLPSGVFPSRPPWTPPWILFPWTNAPSPCHYRCCSSPAKKSSIGEAEQACDRGTRRSEARAECGQAQIHHHGHATRLRR
jgi:hypothetical protein